MEVLKIPITDQYIHTLDNKPVKCFKFVDRNNHGAHAVEYRDLQVKLSNNGILSLQKLAISLNVVGHMRMSKEQLIDKIKVKIMFEKSKE